MRPLALAIPLLLIFGACTTGKTVYTVEGQEKTLSPHTAFAQCLTEKGVKMYGASWCSHCQNQKALFGEAWRDVTYIECALPTGRGQTAACQAAGIQAYPTWEFPDGSRQTGELTFKQLGEKSGCPVG